TNPARAPFSRAILLTATEFDKWHFEKGNWRLGNKAYCCQVRFGIRSWCRRRFSGSPLTVGRQGTPRQQRHRQRSPEPDPKAPIVQLALLLVSQARWCGEEIPAVV